MFGLEGRWVLGLEGGWVHGLEGVGAWLRG